MSNLSSSCLAASLLAASSVVSAEAPQTAVAAAAPPTTAPAAVALPAARPIQNGVVYRDVKYGDASQRYNYLDLYLPTNAKGPVPLIIYIHGGGWSGGDKAMFGAAPQILRMGYAVASINYRLTDEAPFPAQIHDCKGAVRFLRSMASTLKLDADHFGVWGDSAGGHLAALLGTTAGNKDLEGDVGGNVDISSRVQAILDWFGPTDLNHIVAQLDPNRVPALLKQEPTILTRLLGGPIEQKAELAKEASPLNYISGDDAPFLIMHGDQDPLVPLKQSQSMNAALKAAGVASELIVVRGAGHGGAGFAAPMNLLAIANFFSTHLLAGAR